MKKVIAIAALLAGSIAPANADVYVKVDANGNAIGGAIVCDAATCGAGSVYSQLTLQEGESYVLQGLGTTGIGNNNSDTQVKVDIPTQTWTVTTPNSVTTFVPKQEPVYVMPSPPVITETTTVTTDTATVVTDTATVRVETTTATNTSTTFEQLYAQVMALLTEILALIAKLNG